MGPSQRAWWARPDTHANSAPRCQAVAYYRHSAQDRQENSVALQQEQVRQWARENGVEIIKEFADRGRSGLTAAGRPEFKDMMDAWVMKRRDFQYVLCLDVSRWGRFQDIDLSATYSAECKRQGKQVVYTTLGWPKDDDPFYSLYLQFERFRAAQYSKELSIKVFNGCKMIARQGYWVGGKPPFGLYRMLLDEARQPVHRLGPGQRKSIQNQRVTLAPGDDQDVATVQRIFREFTESGASMTDIAAGLNRDGVLSPGGRSWRGFLVGRILEQEIYAGTLVYNRRATQLATRQQRSNPPCDWIHTAGAVEPIVDPAVFERARCIRSWLRRGTRYKVMLERLEHVLQQHGFVKPCLLRKHPTVPTGKAYYSRFGALGLAYQHLFQDCLTQVKNQVEALLRQSIDRVEVYDDFLVLNGKLSVLVQPSVPVAYGYGQYWAFRPDARPSVDITLGVPVSSPEEPQILGYLILPRLLVKRRLIRFSIFAHGLIRLFGHTNLDLITQLARS